MPPITTVAPQDRTPTTDRTRCRTHRVSEVMARLNVSRATVERMIRRGVLEAQHPMGVGPGRRVLITDESLRRVLASNDPASDPDDGTDLVARRDPRQDRAPGYLDPVVLEMVQNAPPLSEAQYERLAVIIGNSTAR